MTRIEKKCWPEFYQKIVDGDKTFELRLADFECNKGDVLVLREWNPDRLVGSTLYYGKLFIVCIHS